MSGQLKNPELHLLTIQPWQRSPTAHVSLTMQEGKSRDLRKVASVRLEESLCIKLVASGLKPEYRMLPCRNILSLIHTISVLYQSVLGPE
jgi:hypothetical protein